MNATETKLIAASTESDAIRASPDVEAVSVSCSPEEEAMIG